MTGEIMRKCLRTAGPFLIMLGIPLLLLSCGFGRSVPSRNYYVLNYKFSPVIPPGSNRPHPFSAQIERFDVQRIYNRQNIVYRFAPQELKWYEYQQWAVRPDYMITDLVQTHLEAAGLFNRLSSEFLDARPDFRIEGTVEALERFDAGDVFYGHMAMSFKMLRADTGQQIWEYSFDERKQVYQREMVYTVIALSQIFQNQMNAVVSQLDSVLTVVNGEQIPEQDVPAIRPSPLPAQSDTSSAARKDPGYEIIPEDSIRRR